MDPSSYETQLSTFSQQGTIDWAALGQMQFSASVAVLGRLAAAGIDSLTIAFGQAMCCRIPLGVHGEAVLHESMKKLVAFSSFGNVIWFGVGVRHVLRDLVQTSQGSALVALSGALNEGYTARVSALVLAEIAKLSGGPRDLTPSFTQWKGLVEVSGSVFNDSTLGVRIQQMTKLGGFSDDTMPSHPTDLAQAILQIGKVVNGNLERVSIQGGAACGWLAAWADFVLGLRVRVNSSQDTTLFVNYDIRKMDAQLHLTYSEDDVNSSSIWSAAETTVVRSGRDFLIACFRQQEDCCSDADYDFVGGRVEWRTMFQSCFGTDFSDMCSNVVDGASPGSLYLPDLPGVVRADLSLSSLFVSMIVYGSAMIVRYTSLSPKSEDSVSYVKRMIGRMPELEENRQTMIAAAAHLERTFGTDYRSIISIDETYNMIKQEIRKFCLCGSCAKEPDRLWRRIYCLTAIMETILDTSRLLEGLVLDSRLLPTRYGLLSAFEDVKEIDSCRSGPLPHWLRKGLMADQDENNTGTRFRRYAKFFSGDDWVNTSADERSAMSNGKLYCYVGGLQGLTDCYQRAATIHVGSGSIQYATKLHRAVFDYTDRWGLLGYAARERSIVTETTALNRDTTTPRLKVKAMVEEGPDTLSFWYNVSSAAGSADISPRKLITRLHDARKYLRVVVAPQILPRIPNPVLDTGHYVLVEGEGIVDLLRNRLTENAHMLRPLRDNLLGRVVAIYNSQQPTALVKSDEDLLSFAEYWAGKFEHDVGDFGSRSSDYYALVS
jgi:hypothetical protein